MLPVLSLVGRPNVGKSTLFNKLTRSRDALVADLPGLTRDRQYGDGKLGDFRYIVIDTGGLAEELADTELSDKAKSTLQATGTGDIAGEMFVQTRQAIQESDLVLFLVDGRAGITAADEQLAARLRKLEVPVLLVVNKIDGVGEDLATAEFFTLAFGEPMAISASHSRGLQRMLSAAEQLFEESGIQLQQPLEPFKRSGARSAKPSAQLPDQPSGDESSHQAENPDESASDETTLDKAARGEVVAEQRLAEIAFIGRPNVGKSTLINRLCGEERVIAFDQPGTTRDTIAIPFTRNGREYRLIDTAGIRRRGKVHEVVEKFSVVKTLGAIEQANVCVYLLDANDGITEQDLQLMGYIIDKGRALVVAINKWDAIDGEGREKLREELPRRVGFLHFTHIHFISALHGSGVNDLFRSINKAFKSARADLATPELTRLLDVATSKHQPPMVNGRRIKLRYAHQGGMNPPVVVVHGNQTGKLPGSYQRYLINFFQKELRLFGTPLQLRLKQSDNPFESKGRNKSTRANSNKKSDGKLRGKRDRENRQTR